MQWKRSMRQAKVLMLHLVMVLRQKVIWDQDPTDQWGLHQKVTWDPVLTDLWDLHQRVIWDHLQVKVDHLQETWQDQDLMDQWDHLQELTWMVMGCLLHLQGIWDQDLMDQWDQIHYLVIVDQQADHLQVIQEDLLQVIL